MDTPVKSLNPNKHLKEQFVSNLSGSSMLELFSLTAVLSIVILLQRAFGFNSQTEALSKKDDNDNGFLRTKNLAKYIAMLSLDFLYIVVPFILYTTVLADWTYINTTIVALLVLLCILAGRKMGFNLLDKTYHPTGYPW
nr:glycosylphosphatidylinositol domain-containing protein [Ipomoea batatas]GMD78237.1 glycosylphosphatidylinositol domain-containing protein [Ipomoea batatas]